MNNTKYIIFDVNNNVVLTHYTSDFNELEWKGWFEDYDTKLSISSNDKPFTLYDEENAKQVCKQITNFFVNEKKISPDEVEIIHLTVHEKVIFVLDQKHCKKVFGY